MGRRCASTPTRIGAVTELGLDETLFFGRGRWRTQQWVISIVDVFAGRLLDVVEGCNAAEPRKWLATQGREWLDGRTLLRWRQIAAWHQAHVSNGPTEAVNNLIKRIKRVGSGFTRSRNAPPLKRVEPV